MEGNSYFLPLHNEKPYTPFEFDIRMSHNELKMKILGEKLDKDIYNSMRASQNLPIIENPIPNVNLYTNHEPYMSRFNPYKFNDNSFKITKNSFKILQSYSHLGRLNDPNLFKKQNKMIRNNKSLPDLSNRMYLQKPEDYASHGLDKKNFFTYKKDNDIVASRSQNINTNFYKNYNGIMHNFLNGHNDNNSCLSNRFNKINYNKRYGDISKNIDKSIISNMYFSPGKYNYKLKYADLENNRKKLFRFSPHRMYNSQLTFPQRDIF